MPDTDSSDATQEKLWSLCMIMQSAHALADIAWPDGLPQAATWELMNIQKSSCHALGLPDDLPIMCGDPTIDL